MIPKSLIQEFELLSESPNAIQKFREMILQLAVRGMLVPQDPKDEPASFLLEKIKTQKRWLIKESKIKKNKQIVPITLNEIPHNLPNSWEWVRLADVGQIVGGGTPRSNNTAFYVENGISWLTPADLYGLKDKYVQRGRRDISAEGLARSSAQLMPAGAILFSSRAPIGYVAIAANDLSTNQGFKSCVPYLKGTNEYLYYYLRSVAKEIDRNATGTTFREISGKGMSQVLLALPPLNEQKRIVAKVDRLMKHCDELEALQKERNEKRLMLNTSCLNALIHIKSGTKTNGDAERIFDSFEMLYETQENVAELHKAIIQLAVQGRLVSQDPNDEPASVLLEKIKAEKEKLIKENKIKKTKKLVPVDPNDVPYELPEGWAWAQVGELCLVRGGKRIPKGMSFSPKVTDHIYIRVTDMKDGTVDLQDLHYISDEVYQQISRYTISKDDLYITIAGTIGVIGEVPVEFDGMNLTENAGKLSFRGINKSYLKLVLNAAVVQEQFKEKVRQMAQPKLALHRIASALVPFPPSNEQKRIVVRVDKLMKLCDELESKLFQLQDDAQKLIESVVNALFVREAVT